jgi:hypothetical protein
VELPEHLISRLLRAYNDRNKQTRKQIEALWFGLTGGGAEAPTLLNSHLLSTIDSLIDGAISKLWRARVGACSANAEIIIARTWYDLGNGGLLALDDYSNKGPKTVASRLLQLYKIIAWLERVMRRFQQV